MRRFRFCGLVLRVARHCSGINSSSVVEQQQPPNGVERLSDVVSEYSRQAFVEDGRTPSVEAVIWKEETTYPPILAKGNRNFYDYTDDIPKHVKPFWSHEWYQQREYFQGMRKRKSTIEKMRFGGLIVSLLAFVGGTIVFVRIWVAQPKEVHQMREEILQHAYGRVLELAAGHGQNIGLYPYAVSDIVLSDASAQQLQSLRYRIPKSVYPRYEVRKMKSEHLEGFADGEFDCVIDMFGLCHYRDPLMALRQMQRVVKPTGSILLLEHGQSPYQPVNWLLDYLAQRHTEVTGGCRWNLPIMELLKDSRMEIRELRNKHYGTTYYVVAYPENIGAIQQEVEAAFQV